MAVCPGHCGTPTGDVAKGRMNPQTPRVVVTWLNSSHPGQNGRRFADDTFKRIFLNENVIISIKISLKFVPRGPINNNPALV